VLPIGENIGNMWTHQGLEFRPRCALMEAAADQRDARTNRRPTGSTGVSRSLLVLVRRGVFASM
jgi:hypothetical protein